MKKQIEIQQRQDQLGREPFETRFAELEAPSRIRVRWGPPPDVIVHQVTDNELDALEQPNGSRYRGHAASLLSLGVGIILPLISPYRNIVIALAASCFGAGLAFILSSIKNRKSPSETAKGIRARLAKARLTNSIV